MAKPNIDRTRNLLASVTNEMLGGDLNLKMQDSSIRVEKILLDLVRPHPVQPRRVLPERIHQAFHQEQFTPTQALRELIQIVQIAARQQSRPFTNVLELIADTTQDESDKSAELSPEETLLRDLVNLAVTIRDDGQVNPLTVVDAAEGVSRLYRIETGERRYWATWLLRDFIPDSGCDGTIPCIVVPSQNASVFRQAKENTARSGLTTIAMARQAALLLLAAHGYEIPDVPVDNGFYRQAIDLDLRGKREYSALILSAMGGIGKAYFSRIKALLKLTDDAMELADRHAIDEKRLRYVAAMPEDAHMELIQQIISLKLTSRQVQQICESETHHSEPEKPEALPTKAVKMARVLQSVNDTSPYDFARALLHQEQNVHLARARIQSMVQLLTESQSFLKEE